MQQLELTRQLQWIMIKDALLKSFDMTECWFRKKFRYCRPEKSEKFIQVCSRLKRYLEKWLNKRS